MKRICLLQADWTLSPPVTLRLIGLAARQRPSRTRRKGRIRWMFGNERTYGSFFSGPCILFGQSTSSGIVKKIFVCSVHRSRRCRIKRIVKSDGTIQESRQAQPCLTTRKFHYGCIRKRHSIVILFL